MLKLLEVLLSNESGDRHSRERPECESTTTPGEGRPEDGQDRQDEHHLRRMHQVTVQFRARGSRDGVRELVAAENAQRRDGHDQEPRSLRMRHMPIMPVMSACMDAVLRLLKGGGRYSSDEVLYPSAP